MGDAPHGEIDPGLRRRQHYLLGGRLLVATLLLGGSIVVRGEDHSGGFTQNALMGLIAATFAMSLLAAVLLPRVRRPELLAGVQLGWDLVLVTGITYLLGGAASGFSFLSGVVILAAALVVGPRATQVTTAVALLAFVGVGLSVANGWIPPPPDQAELRYELAADELALALLRNLVGFVLVGLLAGNLADRLRRTGGQLEQAAASAAGYARLNEDILRSMASGLLTTDLAGRVQVINPAGAEMFGGTVERLVGRELASVLPIDGEGAIERGEGEATRLDGTAFPVGFSCSPLRDASGSRLGQLVVFQDLTELSTLREKAERAERLAALGRLAAGLAHEIRNPLGSISGSVEMVREAPELNEEDRRLLTLVLGEVDRLNDLVTTMLDIGRPRELELGSIDLGSLASEVAKVAQADGGPRVIVTMPDDPVRVTADHAQIRQVLWNLVKNARQLTPARGEVRIEVGWDESSRPCVSVSDDGPGIAPEDRPRLFEMFYTRRRHGIGLGLALVRQIVEAHRGDITVESEPGHGATFTVHLPRDQRVSAVSRPA